MHNSSIIPSASKVKENSTYRREVTEKLQTIKQNLRVLQYFYLGFELDVMVEDIPYDAPLYTSKMSEHN